jgi:hypothetical protein
MTKLSKTIRELLVVLGNEKAVKKFDKIEKSKSKKIKKIKKKTKLFQL